MSTIENRNDTIRQVLADHPEYESFEEVQAECARRGANVGIWAIYFIAKPADRKLKRGLVATDLAEVIPDVALTLLGLHQSANDAISTLNEVAKRNSNGERIPWEIQMTGSTESWELSVAQELLDFCDGQLNAAIDAVWQR